MPDDQEECNDPTHDHSQPAGFFIDVSEMVRQSGQERQGRRELAAMSMQQRLYAFIDELDIDQLFVLRTALGLDARSQLLLEGQVVAALRYKGADPDTGLTIDSLKDPAGEADHGPGPSSTTPPVP
jgi:hypothetical protein